MTAEQSIDTHKVVLVSHVFNPISYLRDELDAASRLIAERNHVKKTFTDSLAAIQLEKDRLLKKGNLKYLDFDPLFMQLNVDLSNLEARCALDERLRRQIQYLMLPGKRTVVQEMRKGFGYFNTMLISQLSSFCDSLAKRLSEAHSELCLRLEDCSAKQAAAWKSLFQKSIHVMTVSTAA